MILNYYKNYRPLWKIDNLTKNARVPDGYEEWYKEISKTRPYFWIRGKSLSGNFQKKFEKLESSSYLCGMKNKLITFWEIYYPVILAFVSFLYSVTLWFMGYQLEGIFVGIWVPSILSMATTIRQRRNDYYNNKK